MGKGANPWFDTDYAENLAKGLYELQGEQPRRSVHTGLRFDGNSRRQRILEILGTSPHWVERTNTIWIVKKGQRINLPPCILDLNSGTPVKGLLAEKVLQFDLLSPFLRMVLDFQEARTNREVACKSAYARRHKLVYGHCGLGSQFEYENWLSQLREEVDKRRAKWKLAEAPKEPKKWWQLKLGWQDRNRDDEW